MKQYDVVRVAAIRGDRFAAKPPGFNKRHPQVGDVGRFWKLTATHLRLSVASATPDTIWLEPMFPTS